MNQLRKQQSSGCNPVAVLLSLTFDDRSIQAKVSILQLLSFVANRTGLLTVTHVTQVNI
ncbi:hypothetical protein QUB17_16260 [Microcoleus sp. B5-C4]